MSDGGEQDEPEDQPSARPSATEGVRILGAEEAQAALDGGQVARRIGGNKPRFGDVPDRPDPAVRPAARFPHSEPGDGSPRLSDETPGGPDAVDDPAPAPGGPTDAGVDSDDPADRAFRDELDALADDGADDVGDEPSGPIDLPHWTEPPTGEMPIIFADSESSDDPDDDSDASSGSAGSSGPAPRFRSKAGDWDESDIAEVDLGEDGDESLADLADPGDDDAEFAASVARRRRLRPRRTERGDGAGDSGGAGAGGGTAPGAGGRVRPGPSRPPRSTAPTGPAGPAGSARKPNPEPATDDSPESDFTTRVIVGVAVAVGALICLRLGRATTAVLASVIVGLAAFEFYEGIRKRGFHPATILGLLAAVTTPLAAYRVGEAAFPLMVALLTVFTMLWFLVRVVPARPLVGIAVTLFGYFYVGGLGGFAGLMLAFPNGVGLILGVALCAVAYDVAGYLVGSQFGKTPLALAISPNKTVEGLVAGMAASIIVAGVIVNQISPWTDLGHALSLGVIVAIVAPLGDLCASMIKRDLNLKDFGTLLPGHGGVLDRFDAILFCLPAVYYLARYLKIG